VFVTRGDLTVRVRYSLQLGREDLRRVLGKTGTLLHAFLDDNDDNNDNR
jgi:predicted RNA-binding protein YlqC (UPF0109 family)